MRAPLSVVGLVVLLTVVLANIAVAQDKGGTVVLRINGAEIRRGEVLEQMEKTSSRLPAAKRYEQALVNLAKQRVLVQAAQKAGLANDPYVLKAANRDQAMIEVLVFKAANTALAAVGVERLREQYTEAVAEQKSMSSPGDVRLRWIFVHSEAHAKRIFDDLKKGASFADVAKRESIDKSAADGGDLGYQEVRYMQEAFRRAVADIKTGEMSKAPFRTQVGWHILQVVDRRPDPEVKVPTFDDYVRQVHSSLMWDERERIATELLETAKIERLDGGGG
jgi:peptidyl-prolyl cis-trans isomerase C